MGKAEKLSEVVVAESHRVIAQPDPSKLTLRGGRHYLERIAEQLSEGSVFVTNIERRNAHYYKKRLSALVGSNVEAVPGSYEGEEGYRFRISKLKRE